MLLSKTNAFYVLLIVIYLPFINKKGGNEMILTVGTLIKCKCCLLQWYLFFPAHLSSISGKNSFLISFKSSQWSCKSVGNVCHKLH